MIDRVEKIRASLQAALNPVQLDIVDDSAAHAGHAGAIQSGGGHFSVFIVAEAFGGKTMVQRHQMVYRALGDLMKTDIHALMIKALIPGESS
ncbi:MAG: BolA family protein [Methylococcus sp.]|jgi:BolA family transcriptional regulator, general stress-responsive regulator